MTIWVDGAFLPADRMPALDAGAFGPFETMGAANGYAPLWGDHLARLTASAARLGLTFAPSTDLRAAAHELSRQNGHTDGVLQLLLVPSGGRVHVVLRSRARGPLTTVRLLPTVVARDAGAPPGDVKALPRTFYDTVQQQAQDGGADDGIVVAADGAVLETATANLWLRLEGEWVTPPLDGQVLPGIARARLLASLRQKGLRVAERRCDLADLHRAEALAHTNAVYGPRQAVLVGEKAPAVRFVDTELVPLWRPTSPD